MHVCAFCATLRDQFSCTPHPTSWKMEPSDHKDRPVSSFLLSTVFFATCFAYLKRDKKKTVRIVRSILRLCRLHGSGGLAQKGRFGILEWSGFIRQSQMPAEDAVKGSLCNHKQCYCARWKFENRHFSCIILMYIFTIMSACCFCFVVGPAAPLISQTGDCMWRCWLRALITPRLSTFMPWGWRGRPRFIKLIGLMGGMWDLRGVIHGGMRFSLGGPEFRAATRQVACVMLAASVARPGAKAGDKGCKAVQGASGRNV